MHKFIYEQPKFLSREFWVHVICWGIFISLEITVTALLKERLSPPSFYLFYIINLGLFYLHAKLLSAFLSKNQIRNAVVIFIVASTELVIYVALAIIFRMFLDRYTESRMSGKLIFNSVFYISTIWRGLTFILYSTGYFFLKNFITQRRIGAERSYEIIRLQNQLLTMEKDFLRSQITPHLFFNTLNFIKYSAAKEPLMAEEAIDTLTDIMDYALEMNETNSVPIVKEIQQMENMIILNKLRYGSKFFLDYTKNIEDDQIQITPIVLLTLVENIFKHGNLMDEKYPATLHISVINGDIKFIARNRIADYVAGKKSYKTGIKNITARLEKEYPDRYHFQHTFNNGIYTSNLLISATALKS
ncbi:sensor histidine kinase [Pedobacter agri]|uniref:sensor histidine kinase n=1 Tax=Pedobacter agri TaxID=454586 RepID=UPI00292F517B|nr:histidine kinase [Pedobacter agri]